jgi:type IV pilus assembly protein PilB
MASNLGDILLQEKIINADQLKSARTYKEKNDVSIGAAVVSLGYANEEDIAQALSNKLDYPFIDLEQFEVFPDVIELIPLEVAKKYSIMPIHRNRSFLTLAMVDPTDLDCIEDIRFRTGLSLQPVIASETSILSAIRKHYGTSDSIKLKQMVDDLDQTEDININIIEETEEDYQELDDEELAKSADEAPIITLVNTILLDAIKKGASDVHFEPYEHSFRVRYRLDGILYEMMNLPLKFRNPVLSRVKILSNMDIAEKRLPQDGRSKMRARMDTGKKKDVDMRISSAPTIFGEKIVVRLLDQDMLKLDLTKLGFEKESLSVVKDNLIKPWGIILVSGPTGSGKTNTLYSAISILNSMEKNIMTAEDPVEFYIPGINQVNIQEEIGLTFSTCLRHFLRQDPDIMLVGEMRDLETVDIAIKAALTGHLIFSTVHTNDAASTLTRLVNMGIEPFLIADSLLSVVAQRLVRTLCLKCRTRPNVSKKALKEIGFTDQEVEDVKVYGPKGCSECNNTGFSGRTALFEVMKVTDDIKDLILNRAHSKDIKKASLDQGMITLRRSGLTKIKNGITSIDEVLRETVKDLEI